jgi:hypothetical protein
MEKTPFAATMEDWDKIKQRKKSVNKVIYWITEEGFDIAQNIVLFPKDVYRNVYAKLHNIFISKTHYLITNLPKGEWHDCNTRILHGLMETLVDFVEKEKANMMIFDEDFNPKTSTPREAGLAYLDWEIALTKDEDYFGITKDDPEFGKPTDQALAAQEIKDIYLWWKDVYPNRSDPMDISGWTEYCVDKTPLDNALNRNKEEHEKVKKMLDIIDTMERDYENEETQMLLRLIKVRNSMWT